jgi:iron complex outermembrane receptor protein
LKGPKDRWELQLFGKNLTNKFYYSSRIDIPVIGQPIGFLPRDFQRYGGGRIIVRF